MGWLAAGLAVLVTVALIVGEITDAALRRWWGSHSLTTDTVSGLMVLLITVLFVNQLLNRRQEKQRSNAVAAQAAILLAQANQSAGAVSSVIGGSGDRDAASDGFRTYMMILLISSPVFIGGRAERRFLEQAQALGGVMAGRLQQINRSTDGAAVQNGRLDDALKQFQSAAAPLIQPLNPGVRDSIQRIGGTPDK